MSSATLDYTLLGVMFVFRHDPGFTVFISMAKSAFTDNSHSGFSFYFVWRRLNNAFVFPSMPELGWVYDQATSVNSWALLKQKVNNWQVCNYQTTNKFHSMNR